MEDMIQAGGKVEIAEEVIRSIAAIAAAEVEGLGGMEGSVTDQVVGIFGGRQKGVETELSDGSVRISLKIAVQYGYPLHELGRRLQERVKRDVEEMTGLEVSAVDVYIQRLQLPHEEAAEAEEGKE
jgi:uncharacterized alkaline shock family protein YloU